MRILVTDGMDPTALAALRKSHEVDVRELDAKGLVAAIPAYHGLVVRSRTKVTKEVLQGGTQLKVIGRAGVGVDNIDVEQATARHIVVVNAPTASTVGVAELAIGHMVSLLRHLPEADLSVRSGRWERARFEGRELFGKTLGLLGSGRIGAEVAKRAQAFGMHVISHDPYLAPEVADGIGVRLVTKDQLFRDADVLSIHAALTSETRGLVGPAQLAKMKRHAVLVNCARGEIVDEGALADALRSGTIAGAAIDVYAKEPPVGSPLLSAPNVVFSPHLGASTAEAQARAGAFVVEQVVKVLAGERPEFLVNPTVYD
jgi:D-3-phosphoglycerate dehydrogenase